MFDDHLQNYICWHDSLFDSHSNFKSHESFSDDNLHNDISRHDS